MGVEREGWGGGGTRGGLEREGWGNERGEGERGGGGGGETPRASNLHGLTGPVQRASHCQAERDPLSPQRNSLSVGYTAFIN